jgi:hypothetical protein
VPNPTHVISEYVPLEARHILSGRRALFWRHRSSLSTHYIAVAEVLRLRKTSTRNDNDQGDTLNLEQLAQRDGLGEPPRSDLSKRGKYTVRSQNGDLSGGKETGDTAMVTSVMLNGAQRYARTNSTS